MVTRLFVIFILVFEISCSQLLDNAEGPLDFLPATSLLPASTPPRILLADPADGSLGISPDTKISILFSEGMNKEFTQSAFSLIRDGSAVGGTFAWFENLMVFSPNNRLSDPGMYIFSIGKSKAESAGGVNLLDDYRSRFSYSTDLNKPKVTQTIPANGNVGVSPNSLITVQFDKPMDKLSVFGAVSLSPSVEFDIPNTVISNNDQTFQFIPKYPLNFGTVYSLNVSTTARDKSGNDLASAENVVFTVGDDLVAPDLISISTLSVPNFVANEILVESGFNRNDVFTLVFNEPVQPIPLAGAIRITPSKNYNLSQISPTNFEIRFLEPLDPVTIYNLTISDAVVDFQNNRLRKSYNFNIRTFGTTTRKMLVEGIYKSPSFALIDKLESNQINGLSTASCPPGNECDQNLYIRFCYATEDNSACDNVLPGVGQILLTSLRLTINREFGSASGACQEYFTNPVDATPVIDAPNITAFGTVAKCLDKGSTYSITVKGGSSGIRDNHGNIMDSDQTILVRFPSI
ncbi:Ig-like domain-containing protein [Leptospira sp. 201903074]|uniref:Ig-like domain-containing protein n=1 Tax=Leptospira abararensis TaxID=2810036 RepID=UPI0019651508|nr:Ig-like domain-containing protein [Leptospira abararensis]MBM9547855.1 Ig-like domain-containing protein [Leptospira abararensis]